MGRTFVTSSEDEIIEGPLTSSDDDHVVQRENENMDNVQAENDKVTSVFNEEATTKNLGIWSFNIVMTCMVLLHEVIYSHCFVR